MDAEGVMAEGSGSEGAEPGHFFGNSVQAIIGCPANRFL